MENQTAQTTAPAPAPAPELNISDLQNLKSIVELATRRGAFAASELSSVGGVFDRLSNFLNSVTPPADEAPKQ